MRHFLLYATSQIKFKSKKFIFLVKILNARIIL